MKVREAEEETEVNDCIKVEHLNKIYRIEKKEGGACGFFKSIFHPQIVEKQAVENLSFTIKKGEIVGLLGPNGAGKSTTIKMMTGILLPTSGLIRVEDIVPYQDRRRNSMKIGVVFGQKTQLWWNLPVIRSFELLKAMYQIPKETYDRNLRNFIEILGISELLNIPVRQLSLGQRMRVEIAASLLHNPSILYLDEPTIGLDIFAKEKIRQFILEINRRYHVTVILTTHDMSDVEKLCQRLIIINNGHKVADDTLSSLQECYGNLETLTVRFRQLPDLSSIEDITVQSTVDTSATIVFDRRKVSAVTLISRLSEMEKVIDFSLQGTTVEEIIKNILKN